MRHGRVWAAAAAILLLGGGSLAFVLWRQHQEAVQSREDLLAAVDAELRGDDREGQRAVLRRVEAALATDAADALALARGRLLLALGQERKAWDAVEIPVTTPGASPESRLVGAHILARIFARTGEQRTGDQARGLAEQHARATGDPGSLFLSWQLAFRTADPEAFAALYRELVSAQGETVEGRTAKALGGPLVGLLATQFGLSLEPDPLASASRGDGPRAVLAQLATELDAAAPLSAEALRSVAERWESPPEELEIAIAYGILAEVGEVGQELSAEQRDGLVDAVRRLERVLASWPTSVDARHALVIALYARGEAGGAAAQGHLRWLLDNAPLEDRRRGLWQALLQG